MKSKARKALGSPASTNTLAWVSGVAGIGMTILGVAMYSRERKLRTLSGALGRTRITGQAPVVGGYSDGNMRTTLRSAPQMPIEQRLKTIQEMVEKSVQDPYMRKVALQATAKCGERDYKCEAKAIYDFVKARVRYTGDIGPIKWSSGEVDGVDLYQSARRTLEFGGGDCDDNAILVSTLAALNGLTPRLRVTSESRQKDTWSHIYAGVELPGIKFLALDTTLPGNQNFGVEAPHKRAIDFSA